MPRQEGHQTIGEVISGMLMEAERLGFAANFIWGHLSKTLGKVRRYYRDHNAYLYSSELTQQCLQYYQSLYADGKICKEHMRKIDATIRRVEEFYLTGTLNIRSNRIRSRIFLPCYFEHLLDEHLATQGYGEQSWHDASWVVKQYLNHFSKLGHETLADVTMNDVRNYVMEVSLAVKSSTLHDIFLYLKQFHVYLKKAGIAAPDAEGLFSETIRREMPIQGYVTDDEICKILNVIDPKTESGSRNIAILLLGKMTGIRACDVIHLKLTDIKWQEGKIQFVQEKTDTMVTLPLMPDVGKALQNYILNFRPQTGCEEVFLRCSPPKLAISDPSTIGTMMRDYQRRAGIERKPFDGKSFHGLRRNLARNLLVAETPPELIAQILGHT